MSVDQALANPPTRTPEGFRQGSFLLCPCQGQKKHWPAGFSMKSSCNQNRVC